ncbi:putative nuclease HARBI1 [Acipenser ruthenus]|uniref:putative nuclease HARBI1 n=1 Tax=Acipenser ruthenus TaxID=7906 RepID=UPI0027404E3E|nr:putative nuclease HARBI1 [Acipenser ruthenus]
MGFVFLGLHKSTASRIVFRVSKELATRLPVFPVESTVLNRMKSDFFSIAGFPNVVGAVDGTHVKIQAPSADEHLYVNRKGYHSIHVQMICDANLSIINCVARWPGSSHDSRILRQSVVHEAFEGGAIPGILLGDSGYQLKPWLLTPFINPTNEAHTRYNNAHTKSRNLIERCFGVLKRRFHCLHGELRMVPERACNIICAAVVLHNIARELALPDVEGPNSVAVYEEEEVPEQAGVDQDGSGRYIRQMIVENCFSK